MKPEVSTPSKFRKQLDDETLMKLQTLRNELLDEEGT